MRSLFSSESAKKIAYSRLRHIAAALNAGENTLFAMLTGYFDDAGGADHGYTVVAGWVSTVERWSAFAEEWEQMLAAFQVSWFDMKTLSHFRGVYARWKDHPEVKSDFQSAACRIIARSAAVGFASIVPHAVFARVNEAYRVKERFGNEYALAGLTCAIKMRAWSRKQDAPQRIETIFDDGTAKRGKLTDAMRKHDFAEPIFGSPLPKGNGLAHVVQLQAADFLAYEVRKVEKDDPSETRAVEEHRISLRKLMWVESDWGVYSEDNLSKLCENLGVGKRGRVVHEQR
jgi:hypothetical protein